MEWDQPPEILGLLSDPLRWQLVAELGRSDRRVGELVQLVGKPQNLVSYHLGELRDAGIVSARRSSADGRDVYYRADLFGCRDLLGEAGVSLHPGLALAPATPDGVLPRRGRPRLLFLCTGNSARSQIAEALVEHHSAARSRPADAGSHPKPLHPNAVRVMAGAASTSPAARPSRSAVSPAPGSTGSSPCATRCAKCARSSPALPSPRTGAFPTPPSRTPTQTPTPSSKRWRATSAAASRCCSPTSEPRTARPAPTDGTRPRARRIHLIVDDIDEEVPAHGRGGSVPQRGRDRSRWGAGPRPGPGGEPRRAVPAGRRVVIRQLIP